MAYDFDNVFAKILRNEIPCDKVFEDDYVLAFCDIAPQAPIHILVVPKGSYIDYTDFLARADGDEIMAFHQAVGKIVAERKVTSYRLIANTASDARQEVGHLHFHILAGCDLGPMLVKD